MTADVVRALPQHRKLLIHVPVDEGQERQRRQEDLRDERRDDRRECGGESDRVTVSR